MAKESKKILFVEDEPNLIDIYHIVFDSHGYAFFSTADIEEAILITEREKPDAVLLDIILPEKKGGTVDLSSKQGFVYLEKVKKDPRTKNIPIIILTNLTANGDRKKAKEMGAVDYLVKADHLPKVIFSKVEKIIKENKKK